MSLRLSEYFVLSNEFVLHKGLGTLKADGMTSKTVPEDEVVRARFGLLEISRSIESSVEYAKQAEQAGFDWVGVADSQSLFRELFVTLAMVGQATERVMIGPAVTNPLTRHPAVMAGAIASVHELSQGRAMLGIATGDSAIYNINERPRGTQRPERIRF